MWHNADREPHAQGHYIEMMDIVKTVKCINKLEKSDKVFRYKMLHMTIDLIDVLDVHASIEKTDMHNAIAKMTPFFRPKVFEFERMAPYKDSLLFKQEERSKQPPQRRSWHSFKTRPKEFWGERDDARKAMSDHEDLDTLPAEMDLVIRPILARRKFGSFLYPPMHLVLEDLSVSKLFHQFWLNTSILHSNNQKTNSQ